MTYSPEQYTVYYTTNSSGCPINSDEGYNKSVTVYGLNHTDFFTIRDQQYNVTLNNLHPYTVYCYKVVATNTEGRNVSMMRFFGTNESGMFTMHLFTTCLLSNFSAPSGPPKNFIILTTSRNINLTWSPPLPSQSNGVIISYFITCSTGGSIINSTRTSSTSLAITGLLPYTNYSCSITAHTSAGGGPAANTSVTTLQDGEQIQHALASLVLII